MIDESLVRQVDEPSQIRLAGGPLLFAVEEHEYELLKGPKRLFNLDE